MCLHCKVAVHALNCTYAQPCNFPNIIMRKLTDACAMIRNRAHQCATCNHIYTLQQCMRKPALHPDLRAQACTTTRFVSLHTHVKACKFPNTIINTHMHALILACNLPASACNNVCARLHLHGCASLQF